MRVVVLLCAVLAACQSENQVRGAQCESDFVCAIEGAQGKCEENGFCSFADDSCPDGFRYSPAATGVESQCVGTVGGGACGHADETCCGESTCAANLACTSGTCTCGDAAGAPCCEGTTCSANLTCLSGTCASSTAAIEQIGLGHNFMCVIRTDKLVECWGRDAFPFARSAPGQHNALVDSLEPVLIANTADAAELKSGEGHSCIKKTDGTLWCWGHNAHGQLGDGKTGGSLPAVQVAGLSGVSMFSVGRQHTCAVGTFAGTAGLYCWGHNGVGVHNGGATASRFGNGVVTDSTAPVAVDVSGMAASGQTVRALLAGGYYSCAVMSDNRPWCWGDNNYGVLGTGNTTDSLVPVLVDMTLVVIPGGVTIDELVGGTGYKSRSPVCFRLSNGTSYCWATSGNYGVQGNGTSTSYRLPTLPVLTTALGSEHFVKLAAMADAVCGLDSAAKVWCWGRGNHGQLGDGLATDSTVPVQVTGLPTTGVTTIVAGHRAACALDNTHRAWCWGNNRRAQLTRTIPADDDASAVTAAVEVKP